MWHGPKPPTPDNLTIGETCTEEDFIKVNDKATFVADFWKYTI